MSARCARCGQYVRSDFQDPCGPCLALQSYGWEVCHEAVTGRDGVEEPCDRPAYGIRVDPDHLTPYPVCRKHRRSPLAFKAAS